jgi:hypothetical protein
MHDHRHELSFLFMDLKSDEIFFGEIKLLYEDLQRSKCVQKVVLKKQDT